jgi:hypothetical protein
MQYLSVIDMTNDYLRKKWGQFYFDTCTYCGCLIGSDPGREVWDLTDEHVKEEIEKEFIAGCDPKVLGGIGELMHLFRSFGEQFESITELGVQKGTSTIGFAAGKPKIMRGYELHDVMEERLKALLGRYVGWKYTIANSLEIEIEETDVLFIDTFHEYKQVLEELKLHSNKVKHYILLHDVGNCGIYCEVGLGDGLLRAINEFLANNDEWFIEKTLMYNHGLTILKRRTV